MTALTNVAFGPRTRGFIRSVFVVGSSTTFVVASSFARGVILARILGPAQYGLALILITITSALDLFADAGIDRFIVQNRFGYRPDVLATSHTFRVAGSLAVAMGIVTLSCPLSRAFHAPELWLPIALTGGVVALRGFANLSYKLQQREHRFEKETALYITMYAVDLATMTLITLITHNFWAVLAGAYANATTHLVLSHLRAARPYSFLPRRRLLALVGRFSLPIYVNAALLFAAAQGDRMAVAASFSKRDLAFYAAACAIGQGAVAIAGKVTMSTLLPILAARGASLESRRRRSTQVGALIVAGSLVFLMGLTLVGPFAVPLLYGKAFAGLTSLIFASAVVQMIQLEQGWLTTLLMANGLTTNFPLITMLRAAAFPAAFAFVALGFSILSIPLAFAIGAAFSLAMSYYSARNLKLVDPRLIMASFARIFVALAAVLMLAQHR